MRCDLSVLVTLAVAWALASGCSLVAKSPALSDPLHERLAKADTSTIEDASKACLTQEGWTPDDVAGDAEGATVVSAKNGAKSHVSLYIQPMGMSPRVTGDPPYDDPFWPCLGRQLARAKASPAGAPSTATP
jgi:hypothetical protein